MKEILKIIELKILLRTFSLILKSMLDQFMAKV